ncbi:MAG TPA: hypothetical protein VF366_08170 [Dehalococcoidia bacterium]
MNKGRGLIHSLVLTALLLGFASACFLYVPQAAAQDKQPFVFPTSDNETALPSPACSGGIAIDNGIINVNLFGELFSAVNVWLYPNTYTNCFQEAPAMSYGANLPKPLALGTITQCYPLVGSPDTWYEAIVELDLDGGGADIEVHREIMVPSNASYFLAKYTINNIKGSPMSNFRFFQGVDYDVASSTANDEGGYDQNDFVWEHKLVSVGTYVGFKGDSPSSHHDVASFGTMWADIAAGNLNDADYYKGDAGVAMEWDMGNLPAGASKTLTETFAFASSWDELNSIFMPVAPTQETISPPQSSPPSEIPPMRLKQAILSTNYASVSPQQTNANQPVTISTNVVNSGDDTGNYSVVLKINGQVEQSKMVSVGPGGVYPVKFTITKSEPGQYVATIDGHKVDFVVLGDKTSRPSANSGPIILVVTGILVFAIAVVLMLSFRRPA